MKYARYVLLATINVQFALPAKLWAQEREICHPQALQIKLVDSNVMLPAMAKLFVKYHGVGWFFGFKLHLAVNDRGELLACCLTPGNVDDRTPVPQMVKKLRGKLFGDRGYISASLVQLLFEQGLQLITRLRKNMKNRFMHLSDTLLLRKRAIIETIIDQLKNISQIEHSRHRSPTNFVVHLITGLIAYSHQDKKPGLHLDEHALLTA